MRRRGLTLIELLLSLALLGSLCSLLTAWLVTTSRIVSEHSPRLKWQTAARTVLSLIEADLECGDFDARSQSNRHASRIEISDEGILRIQCRSNASNSSSGAVTHEYALDGPAGVLSLNIIAPGDSAAPFTRPLLDDVAGWLVTQDVETRTIAVGLESSSGLIVRRRFTWP